MEQSNLLQWKITSNILNNHFLVLLYEVVLITGVIAIVLSYFGLKAEHSSVPFGCPSLSRTEPHAPSTVGPGAAVFPGTQRWGFCSCIGGLGREACFYICSPSHSCLQFPRLGLCQPSAHPVICLPFSRWQSLSAHSVPSLLWGLCMYSAILVRILWSRHGHVPH